jgi:tetratricopeptide (TPR) repeat protein
LSKVDTTHAKLLQERGEHDAAFSIFCEALTADFDDYDSLYRLGLSFAARGHYGPAANILARCAQANPKDALVFLDLAHCFRQTDQIDKAEELLRLAVTLTDDARLKSMLVGNIAGCYCNNGTPERGIELYDEAIAIDPTNKHHVFNKGLLQLEMSQWEEGFKNYEFGFTTGQRPVRTYEGVTPWRPGVDIKGKTVIVWGEQGIGDEIMSASMIPDLMRDAGRVIFDCHPRLVALFERSFGIKCYGTRKTTNFDWWRNEQADVSMSITSLGTLYRSKGEFPGTPYLKRENHKPDLVNDCAHIGIAWAGGTIRNKSQVRSIPLEQWAPLLKAFPKAQFYSLQYQDNAATEVAEFREKTGIDIIHNPGRVQCQDYSRTADFVGNLDLVISVCTSVIHLAGALGVPCWVLTPSKPAWRYGLKGKRMAWYSSVTLYRQTGDEWGDVFAEVQKDLMAFLAEPDRRAAE